MESSQLDHAATGASPTSTTSASASQANDHANAASNGVQTAANETDFWGALSPMGGSFTTLQPVINVSHAPLSASSASNPFDAFDAFAPSSADTSGSRTSSSTSTLVLPPPAPQSTANAVVSLGSPLISFSPVANVASSSASLSLDTTHTTTMTSTTTSAFAVDDLLSFSFSPVAAPPSSSLSSSSSLMMMDDFFLGSTSTSSSSTSAATNDTTTAFTSSSMETTTATTTSSLLSFSPVANVSAAQTPFSDSFGSSDLSDFSRGSFGGFEGGASIDHIAPHSAPAAFEEMDASLEMAREDVNASVEVSSVEEHTQVYEDETHTAEAKAVEAEASEDQDVRSAAAEIIEEKSAVAEHSEELHDAFAFGDEGSSPVTGAWDQHDVQEDLVATTSAEQESTVAAAADAVVESECQTEAGEDWMPQHPRVFDHEENTAHTIVEEISSAPVAESSPEIRESVSSSDLVAEAAEEIVVETVVVETSVPQPAVVDHTAVEAISADDEPVSESALSPVSLGTEPDEQSWQSQPSPAAEPVTAFDAISTSSGHESQPSDVADDDEGFMALDGDDDFYAERESDAMESQFESEATALYAEVDDDDEEHTSDQHHDHPVLNVSVVQLQLPLPEEDTSVQSPENRVNTPSSVVSSPGSSVAGSAFAFISGGASSFAFTPSVPSPQPEPSERESFDRESFDGEEERFSPVAAQYAVAAEEEDICGSVEEDSEWTSTREENEIKEPAPAEIELDDEEVFTGFNDGAADAGVHSDEVASSPTEEPAQSFDFQSSIGVSHKEEGDDDGFGGFNDTVQPITSSSSEVAPPSAFGFESFTQNTASASAPTETDSSFGFVSTAQPAEPTENDDDDGFGGFGQLTTANGDDDDDDFGDFGTSDAWGSSTASGGANGDDDDDFGDFTPSSSSQQWGEATTASATVAASSTSWGSATYEPQPVAIAAPSDLNEFFGSAFPASKAPVATSLLPKPTPSHGSGMMTMTASAIFDQANGGAVHKSFHASLQEYRTMLTAEHDEHPHQQQPSFESEALRLNYLKYVLTEKLTEASRPDGVFPHGSEKYHLFASIAESGHEKNMRDALAQLQEGLFQGSVNEAVMRIAKQAALSAKARIAEQAAQQQAHARGSLLATTRHFLSRTAASSSSGGPEKDTRSSRTGSGSLGVLTPTTASVHKMSRFAFQNGQESEVGGNSSGYGSGEDTGSDVSVGEASGHSEGDVAGPPGGSGPPSSGSSGRGGGGLMKKFQDRLTSFSSTKQRSRTVSLRRMGQSSEDVVKMELHMESINGGFDEVKWRCAVFLYETEEVSHLAPSQIKILAYPSNQLLSGKSDKSALSKFFKPGTIWSIDIGANSNAGVSME